jgi:diguanylate cyclase (GGDEF)-like protein
MVDLDNFKVVNDTFGHGAGDQALYEFGQICKRNLRKIDILGRLGGDEFVVLLPETERKAALLTAERLRSETEKLEVIFENSLVKFTASFGVSILKGNIKNLLQLIASADKALYEAKGAGKNKVVSA